MGNRRRSRDCQTVQPMMMRSDATMQPVRVAVIGCGHIAQHMHLPILHALRSAQLVAVADTDTDDSRLVDACRLAPEATGYGDYLPLLERADVEAVFVCLPTHLHAAAAQAAMAAGKHVYLEKPIAANLEDARTVIEASRLSKVTSIISFNYRFDPVYAAARRRIADDEVGQLTGVRTIFTTAASEVTAWRQSRRLGGGVLLEIASHHIDLMRFLFGRPIERVTADVRSQRSEDDTATLHLAGGLLVQSLLSTCAVEADRVEIYGDGGLLNAERFPAGAVEMTGTSVRLIRVKRLLYAMRRAGQSPYLHRVLLGRHEFPSCPAAFSHFLDAVRGHCPATPTLDDGLESLAVVIAAERSARTGRSMAVKDIPCESHDHQ